MGPTHGDLHTPHSWKACDSPLGIWAHLRLPAWSTRMWSEPHIKCNVDWLEAYVMSTCIVRGRSKTQRVRSGQEGKGPRIRCFSGHGDGYRDLQEDSSILWARSLGDLRALRAPWWTMWGGPETDTPCIVHSHGCHFLQLIMTINRTKLN